MISTTLICPDCGLPMRYVAKGRYGAYYACEAWPRCRGAHGAHPDGSPLGAAADARTRAARIRAHDAFDQLWRNQPAGAKRTRRRHRAYAELREYLQLSRDDCHIGQFSIAQCARVLDFVASMKLQRAQKEAERHVSETRA